MGLLRANDRHHERVKAFFASLRPGDLLLTTWPVVTEAAFIMRRHETIYWDWLLESELEIEDFGLHDLPCMREWRNQYADREVDFSDQTMVWLGDQRHTNLIATTDFDDFETYRLPNGKAFKILIDRP